jgi:hypothetical protein
MNNFLKMKKQIPLSSHAINVHPTPVDNCWNCQHSLHVQDLIFEHLIDSQSKPYDHAYSFLMNLGEASVNRAYSFSDIADYLDAEPAIILQVIPRVLVSNKLQFGVNDEGLVYFYSPPITKPVILKDLEFDNMDRDYLPEIHKAVFDGLRLSHQYLIYFGKTSTGF